MKTTAQKTKKASPRPAPGYTRHRAAVIEESRARLYHYVDNYPDYIDRDRDILTLAIFDMLEGLKTRP